MVMRYITIILLALASVACSSALPSLKPYRMDIQQGNVVTSKMMLQLRPGMTKSQVRFIMGTPLIQDSFHADRWDYFYEMRKGGKIIERRRVIMEFENDALKRVRGDVIPAGTGEPVTEPTAVTQPTPSKKKTKEEKGLLDRLKFWKDDEDAQEKPQEAPAELISPAAKPAEPASAVPAEEKTAPAAPPAQPKATREPTTEPKPTRQKGMPEPGAPLGPDPEHLERGTAPAVETPQAREIDDSAPQPVAPAPEPTPAEAVSQPASPATPAQQSPAPAKPEPATAPAKSQQPVEQRSKPEPEGEDDLPPEEDPGYFERMLEKIGF